MSNIISWNFSKKTHGILSNLNIIVTNTVCNRCVSITLTYTFKKYTQKSKNTVIKSKFRTPFEQTWDWGGDWREGDDSEETESSATATATAEGVKRFVLILRKLVLMGRMDGIEVVGRRSMFEDDDDANMFIVKFDWAMNLKSLKLTKERTNWTARLYNHNCHSR